MKQKNNFGVWHRCRVCGTVFSDSEELRAHSATHPTPVQQAPVELPLEDPEDIVIPSVLYRDNRPQRQNKTPRVTKTNRFAPSWRS